MDQVNNSDLNARSKSFRSRLPSKLKNLDDSSISNYIIQQKIGKGGFANVKKAVHRQTGEEVAVKIISKDASDLDSVYNEIRLHKSLQHSNIAKLIDVVERGNKIYIFMEYCPNGDLFDLLSSEGAMTNSKTSQVFSQMVSALQYMHSKNIVHRDIKAENIVFDKNWNAKLIDFGFAWKQPSTTLSTFFCGSPSYTSPEIAQRLKYDPRKVDIWCLGVTLYGMLTGQLPFDEENPVDLKSSIIGLKYTMKSYIPNEAKKVLKGMLTYAEDRIGITEIKKSGLYVDQQKNESSESSILWQSDVLIPIEHHQQSRTPNVSYKVKKGTPSPSQIKKTPTGRLSTSLQKQSLIQRYTPDFTKNQKTLNTKRHIIALSKLQPIRNARINIQPVNVKKFLEPIYEPQSPKRELSPDSPRRILDLVKAYNRPAKIGLY